VGRVNELDPPKNTIRPSGAHDGSRACAGAVPDKVRTAGTGEPFVADADTVYRAPEIEKTSVDPSGDQSGESSEEELDVTRVGVPPAEDTTQTSR
jgi:hypothetical protein